MTVADLLAGDDLPDGFAYPSDFLRVVALGLTNLEPWWIVTGDLLRERDAGLKTRYADRALVPFAVRQDNDDVAAWDLDTGTVVIVHDFASPGHEQRAQLDDFAAWLHQAIEDLLTFE
jgi:hypothetical protein